VARTAALVGLVAAVVGCKAAWCATALTSPGVEAILPLGTIPETTASAAAALPRFDAWAPQPRLACSLPAIEAWDVVRNVHARTDVPSDAQSGVGPPHHKKRNASEGLPCQYYARSTGPQSRGR